MALRPGLRIAFVTHGGPTIGLGHLRRCLALATAWAAEGAHVTVLIPPCAVAASIISREGGLDVLAVPWKLRPEEACSGLRQLGPDVVVVDSYDASPELFASLGEVGGCLVAVDDLADRLLPVHVVVNGGIVAEHLPYHRGAETLFLLGPRYALVDPRFAEAPEPRAQRQVERLLIALGGGSHADTLTDALAAAEAALGGVEVHVVAGPFTELGPDCARRGRIVVHRDPPDMRALMLAAEVAIAGAGVTLYELAATGTPAVVVQMADNQAPNANGFASVGGALLAGVAGQPGLRDSLEAALRRLAGSPSLRAAVAARGRALVDGAGALRAAREITARVAA